MATQTLTINIKPSNFNPIYLKYSKNITTSLKILFGGSSSGKSVEIATEVVCDVLEGYNYLICRKVQATVKKSVFNEVRKAIIRLEVSQYFTINKSDLEITNKLNGKQILFVGLDDPEKVKSITPAKGVINKIWVEEATEAERDDIKQLKKRLRGMSRFKKQMILSFNPILQTHWIYIDYFKDFWVEGQNFIANKDISILKTTYIDNEFLTVEDKELLESETDRYWYEVYTLGNWGILGHVIFKNWKVEEFDTGSFDRYYNGIDWGFSNDPFAFVRTHFNRNTNKLYICDVIYQLQLLNKESAPLVMDKIGIEVVMCDSNEPKSVSEYQQLGVNAYSAKKGKGSIEYGIKFMQALEIIIHPRCQAYINEIQTYQYKEDKDGNALPIPLGKNDHLLDATRYALEDECFRQALNPKPTKTLEALKKMDVFNRDYEKWEDDLGVDYHGSNPFIRPEANDSSGGVVAY